MQDHPTLHYENQEFNNRRRTIPPNQIVTSDPRSDAVPSVESRRRPRPKLSLYLTGQRSKSNLTTSSTSRADTTSIFGLPSWNCNAFGQEPPSPAAPPDTRDLLESILKHVLANPLQPLPIQFNSGLSYVIEEFQRLEDELNQSNNALNREIADRQAAERNWSMERKYLETEMEILQTYLYPRQEIKGKSESHTAGHTNQKIFDELRGAVPGVARLDVSAPSESGCPTLHSSRSAFELRANALSKVSSQRQHVLTSTAEQDAKNLQTIASLIAKRQGIPIADVWSDVAFLYFERFKASGRSTQSASLESAGKPNSSKESSEGYGNGDNPIERGSALEERHPPLATTSNVSGHSRDFSFSVGDDCAASDGTLNPCIKSSLFQSPVRNSSGPKDELLQATFSQRKSAENSTTPESEKRAWDCLKRSRIPSPVQDVSYLARPRRESSASSMLTSVHVGREQLNTTGGDVPKLALTPAGYTKDDEPNVRHSRKEENVKTSTTSCEKARRRNLTQSKSTESLKKGGDGRLTTSTFARKVKNIGSSSKSPSK